MLRHAMNSKSYGTFVSIYVYLRAHFQDEFLKRRERHDQLQVMYVETVAT